MEVINSVGRRKASVARVYLKEGKGNITINKRDYKEYFPLGTLQYKVTQPLELLEVNGNFDIMINVAGGGYNGQAEAIRLGIARCLVKLNEDDKAALRAAGFMTRDPRVVERKKPGQKKARKKFQFSKR
jgi:small subunit ribosomal protein S9